MLLVMEDIRAGAALAMPADDAMISIIKTNLENFITTSGTIRAGLKPAPTIKLPCGSVGAGLKPARNA